MTKGEQRRAATPTRTLHGSLALPQSAISAQQRVSQLQYQAQYYAMKDGCDCTCCEKSRQVADLLANLPAVEISDDGARNGHQPD
jgi:hypothetical protein